MVPNPRKPDVVKRNLESVQKALKEREKRYARFLVFIVMMALTLLPCRHGASVEEMAKEVNKAKEQLDKAEKELKQMSSLNKVC
jgi:structural maintenance of chromosomes protein 6